MSPIARLSAWMLGVATAAIVVVAALGVYSRLDRHLWMVFALGIVVGLVMGTWPHVAARVKWSVVVLYMTGAVSAVGGAKLIFADRTSLSPILRALALNVQAGAVFVAALVVVALIAMAVRDGRKSPWASGWLVGLLACSVAVVYFSGSRGAPGGSAVWLAQVLHIDMATAEALVHYGRKAVHFTFYGLLASFAFLAARHAGSPLRVAAVSALSLALAHAVTDEWRQSSSPVRNGTPWDVLLDMAGAGVAVALAWRVGQPGAGSARGVESAEGRQET